MVPEDTCVDIFHPRLRRYQSTRFHRVQRPRTIPTLPRFFSKTQLQYLQQQWLCARPVYYFQCQTILSHLPVFSVTFLGLKLHCCIQITLGRQPFHILPRYSTDHLAGEG
jgi:hypothetical protein